jgi:dTDP-glucose pyrophosphorylase
MEKLLVVVLAGGVGARFSKGKYGLSPKPLIQVFGKSQLTWSLIGAVKSFPDARICIGSRSGLCEEIQRVLSVELPEFELEILDIGELTLGAAETAKRSIEMLGLGNSSSSVVFADNDCLNYLRINQGEFPGDFVSVVQSSNAAHCFVEINDRGEIISLHEKGQIREYAISGLYGFHSIRDFMQAYQETEFNQREYYLSAVLSTYLSKRPVKMIKPVEYHSFGTPEEIDSLKSAPKDLD